MLGIGLCGDSVASAGPIPFIAPAASRIAAMVSRAPGVGPNSAGAVRAGLLSVAHLASSQFFTAPVWTDGWIGWIRMVEESQRDYLLPVGVTTAVLVGVHLAWVLFKRPWHRHRVSGRPGSWRSLTASKLAGMQGSCGIR